MQGINRISGMSSMPVNCGMKGMHENQIKSQQENKITNSNQASSMKNMKPDCGVKGMHENSPSNQAQTNANQSSVPNALGSKIDVSA